MSLLFVSTYSAVKSEATEPSLWTIQKLLASKKYVAVTHEFARGIPHWPGFPDETRKPIYWYDKRPNILGVGFFSGNLHIEHEPLSDRAANESGSSSRIRRNSSGQFSKT